MLSVNLKAAEVHSTGPTWERGFADISQPPFLLHKLCKLSGLTVCLDQKNEHGTIDAYQEPLIYQCYLQFRLRFSFLSSVTMLPSVTQFHVLCDSLPFSCSDAQAAMLAFLVDRWTDLLYPPVVTELLPPDKVDGTQRSQAGGAADLSAASATTTGRPQQQQHEEGGTPQPQPRQQLERQEQGFEQGQEQEQHQYRRTKSWNNMQSIASTTALLHSPGPAARSGSGLQDTSPRRDAGHPDTQHHHHRGASSPTQLFGGDLSSIGGDLSGIGIIPPSEASADATEAAAAAASLGNMSSARPIATAAPQASESWGSWAWGIIAGDDDATNADGSVGGAGSKASAATATPTMVNFGLYIRSLSVTLKRSTTVSTDNAFFADRARHTFTPFARFWMSGGRSKIPLSNQESARGHWWIASRPF